MGLQIAADYSLAVEFGRKISYSRTRKQQRSSGEAPGPLAPSPSPCTTSDPIWLRLRTAKPKPQHEAATEGSLVSAGFESELSWDLGKLSHTPSQLQLLAPGSWEAQAVLQAHQKCLRYFSNGSANCRGCQVFDGMNFGCKSNI